MWLLQCHDGYIIISWFYMPQKVQKPVTPKNPRAEIRVQVASFFAQQKVTANHASGNLIVDRCIGSRYVPWSTRSLLKDGTYPQESQRCYVAKWLLHVLVTKILFWWKHVEQLLIGVAKVLTQTGWGFMGEIPAAQCVAQAIRIAPVFPGFENLVGHRIPTKSELSK